MKCSRMTADLRLTTRQHTHSAAQARPTALRHVPLTRFTRCHRSVSQGQRSGPFQLALRGTKTYSQGSHDQQINEGVAVLLSLQ